MTWFVWVRGLTRPAPWKVFSGPDERPAIDPRFKHHVIYERLLRSTEDLASFDELTQRYPPPQGDSRV